MADSSMPADGGSRACTAGRRGLRLFAGVEIQLLLMRHHELQLIEQHETERAICLLAALSEVMRIPPERLQSASPLSPVGFPGSEPEARPPGALPWQQRQTLKTPGLGAMGENTESPQFCFR